MATEARATNLGLMQELLERPHAFSFYQVVQLLQRYTAGAPLGHEGPAGKEAVRIRPTVSLSFPAADLETVERISDRVSGIDRFLITTSFMGFYSSDSPLPVYYTEDLLWKETDQGAVRDFLDVFHHRAFSLLFRAWQKYRHDIQFKRRGADEFSRRIYSLIGLGTPALIEAVGLPSVRLLSYAGAITQRPHSAAIVAGVLRDYFGLERLDIEQCHERWVAIEPSQQNRIGSRNCSLGRDFILGSRVRDRSGKFRISVGPVGLKTFMRLTPTGEDFAGMVNLTRFMVGDRLDFDIEVRMAADEVPRCEVSSTSPQKLGWTSWLPGKHSRTSVVFRQPRTQIPQTQFPWPEVPVGAATGRARTS